MFLTSVEQNAQIFTNLIPLCLKDLMRHATPTRWRAVLTQAHLFVIQILKPCRLSLARELNIFTILIDVTGAAANSLHTIYFAHAAATIRTKILASAATAACKVMLTKATNADEAVKNLMTAKDNDKQGDKYCDGIFTATGFSFIKKRPLCIQRNKKFAGQCVYFGESDEV